jgi:hypothetical protein
MTFLPLPELLAIHGRAYTGKDELAAHLATAHGYQPIRIAQPLEDGLVRLLGHRIDHPHRTRDKEAPIPGLGRSWRQLIQIQGAMGPRHLRPRRADPGGPGTRPPRPRHPPSHHRRAPSP